MAALSDAGRVRNAALFKKLGFTPDQDAPISERNPVKVFRRMCMRCCGGSSRLVEECQSADCPLFPWRLGFNPYRLVFASGHDGPLIMNANTASADGSDDEPEGGAG